MSELDPELTEIFLGELEEVAEHLEACFVAYESEPANPQNLQSMFRYFHNIKGSSKTLGFGDIAEFAHHAESILSGYRDRGEAPDPGVMQILFDSVDAMRVYSAQLRAQADPGELFKSLSARLLCDAGKVQSQEPEPKLAPEPVAAPAAGPEQAPAAKGESGFVLFAEEQPQAAPVFPPEPAAKRAVAGADGAPATPPPGEEHIRVATQKISEVLDLFGEQVILLSGLNFLLEQPQLPPAEKISGFVSQLMKISHDIQHTMITLRMVSLKPLFQRLTRTVRDVAKMTGKEVEFVKVGELGELDKSIADALVDPLNHMVRNAIDHGIESPAEREAAGKPVCGTLTLTAARSGGSFQVQMQDDGRGLDRELILQSAVRKGLVAAGAGAAMSDREVFSLIFGSGFSTRSQANEISGRGVGMNVVLHAIRSLKGDIQIDSKLGRGTTFTIQLPLSLAMFNGTIVGIGGQRYVVPNSDYREIISSRSLKTSGSCRDLAEFKGEVYHVLDLRDMLRHAGVAKDGPEVPAGQRLAMLVPDGDENYAFVIDEINAQEQIVLKELTNIAKDIDVASGGSILGDGHVALVLELGVFIRKRRAQEIKEEA